MLGPVFLTSPNPPRSETELTSPYQPYQKLPGAPSDNAPNGNPGQSIPPVPNLPSVWEDAVLVFPRIDGTTNVLDWTPDFASATAGDFMGWHSAHQVEYLATGIGTAGYIDPPLSRETTSVTVDSIDYDVYYKDFGNGEIFLLSQAQDRVYRLNTLLYADIAKMPLADQIALAALPDFAELIGEPMNLQPTGTQTVESARTDMQALVQSKIDEILSILGITQATADADRDTFLETPTARAGLYHLLFTEQLELYKLRLDNMALFNEDKISLDLDEILERFVRYQRYLNFPTEVPPASSFGDVTENVNSSDGGETVRTGAGVFLKVETQMYELALQKAFIVATGTNLTFSQIVAKAYDTANTTFVDYSTLFDNVNTGTEINTNPSVLAFRSIPLDGPNLLFMLQNLSSQEAEAEAEGKTEELNQTNRLLEDYSAMQRLLNDTLKEFDPAVETDEEEDEDPQTLTLLMKTRLSELNTEDHPNGYVIASMFDTLANVNNPGHPIEVEKDIIRPTEIMTVGGSDLLLPHTRTYWDALAINLGDTTKTISQDSQIRMDEINNLNKTKNRTFDLGSNSLNKLTEILRSIVAV